MPVPGLSLLGLKRIRGFVSILRYINPTIIIIIILDLSYGGDYPVNGVTLRGAYDCYDFKLILSMLDCLIADILACNDDPKLSKVDISREFRNVRVDRGWD